MATLKLTDHRRVFLGKIAGSADWVRENGRAFNTRSNRTLPEPAYWWFVEHHLIEEQDGRLIVTPKGRDLLTL